MTDIDILQEFLKMPLENTEDVFEKFLLIPGAIHRGHGLEQFVFVNGKRKNKVVLVAHADTVWDSFYTFREHEIQDIYQENGIFRNRNGGLGADDRAGCAILWLLKDSGHSLLITNGEEGGRMGSRWLMNENQDIAEIINQEHQFAIQLDRRGDRDFKCYSVGTNDFRAYIEEATGYTEPDRRSFTDIVTLCNDMCGVNLSIGYQNEHSEDEYLVKSDWENTLELCRTWLSNEELPRFTLRVL
ncbi:conserved hypothetical protein [Gammaproteobacteria bacterium]